MPLSRLIRFGTLTWTYEGWQGRELGDSTESLVTPSLWTHDHAQRGDARISIPKSHDLLSLYRDLPQSMTIPIEDLYEKTKRTAIGKNAAFELAIACGPVTPEVIRQWDSKKSNPPSDNSLKAVLARSTRSSDAFQTWRYLHEGGRDGELMIYVYEFARLNAAAKCMRAHLGQVHAITTTQQRPTS